MNRAGMPSESEINRQFIEVVKELELSVERQVALFALPIEKKWLMIQAHRGSHLFFLLLDTLHDTKTVNKQYFIQLFFAGISSFINRVNFDSF